MKIQPGPDSLLLIALCGLLFLMSPVARGDLGDPSFDVEPLRELPGSAEKAPSFSAVEAMSEAWRHEYLKTYLSGYLFREDLSFCPYDEVEEEGPGSSSGAAGTEQPVDEGQINCGRRCRMGERNLAAGFLPEALAEYMTAAEKGCPYTIQGCRPRVGMLKADLAMGRLSEARRSFLRLSRRYDLAQEDLFILIGGILAAFEQDYDEALERFTKTGTDWHLVANVEGIAAFVLFRKGRYEDARNVFRVAMHSPWVAVRHFGVLGLADCTLSLGQWGEAEPLYELLVREGSPLGLLGFAEYKVRQGKVDDARKSLEELVSSSKQDAWRGVALAYLMALRTQPDEWAESLRLAREAKALVLPAYWRNVLTEKTVEALEGGIRSLWERDAHEDLLILAEEWRGHQAALRQDVQLLIGKAYEQAGLKTAALEVYSRLSADPEALFQGALLAWRCGEYKKARDLLEKYLESDREGHRNDARLLLGCVHARQNRLDLAKESLRGMGRIESPSMLIVLASVEASVGMEELAIDHLRTALEDAVISEAEREHLQYVLGELNFQQGRFREALRWFRMARGGEGTEPGTPAEPMEALCLARIDKPEEARTLLDKMPKDPEWNFVGGILDAEDLLRSLKRKGYGF